MSNQENWPQWLKDAKTENARVEILPSGRVVWNGGVWYDGEWNGGRWNGGKWYGGVWNGGEWNGGVWNGGRWYGGVWNGGVWYGGVWNGGEWNGGEWNGGVWYDGVWYGGVWYDGEWNDGEWNGGEWNGGVWYDGEWNGGRWNGGEWNGGVWNGGRWNGGVWYDGRWNGGVWYDGRWYGGEWYGGKWCDACYDRLLYHAAMCGIVFDVDGFATAYRTTRADGSGRYSPKFKQPEGEFFEDDLPPSGSGTCCKGIHVASAAVAWRYFSIDTTCQFWQVRFRREDLLDCDGEKARIRGGIFTKIDNPLVVKP